MSIECKFCGSLFTRVQNMLAHQKSAKYCLDVQESLKSPNLCESCGKSFNQRTNLLRHKKTCQKFSIDEKSKYIGELEARNKELERTVNEQKDRIEALETKTEKLEADNSELKLRIANGEGQIKVYKERPGVVNYVNNKLLQVKCNTIRPFTIETVREEVQSGGYTFDQYIRGENGLVDFISAIISQDDQRSYVCTDTSRHRFHRLLESREWQNDNGASFLNKVFDELKQPSIEYYNKICAMMGNPKEDQDVADILMDKTKTMFFGITQPKSKERPLLFNKIRNEVRHLAVI